jgi:hypothetical protein
MAAASLPSNGIKPTLRAMACAQNPADHKQLRAPLLRASRGRPFRCQCQSEGRRCDRDDHLVAGHQAIDGGHRCRHGDHETSDEESFAGAIANTVNASLAAP